MSTLRIALAQFDFPAGALVANEARIAGLIAEARDRHRVDLIVFPELALSGCPAGDLLRREDFLEACAAALRRLAASTRSIAVVLGWPERTSTGVYNVLSLLRGGAIEASCGKRALSVEPFDECRHFVPGSRDWEGSFELDGVRIRIAFDGEAAPAQTRDASELWLIPAAAPCIRGARVRLGARLGELARARGVGIAWLNRVGGQDDFVFDGGSTLIDAGGHAHPPAAAFQDALLLTDFDPSTRRFVPLGWPREEEGDEPALLWRAIVRGIRDYCARNGFEHAWLGLSGGIDSALVLALAVDALGPTGVTAVRLPSRYTSDLSDDLAAAQAQALGVPLLTIPIEAPFRGFLDALEPVFFDSAAGQGGASDVTAENLQARCRGTLLMALANREGGLLLTTGNRSEYAVGYATIYGDMCGGFAPLRDLYKTEVFELARWRNRVPMELPGRGVCREPIPPAVIERAPSAELRENQTDQDSLPPYEVLDEVLRRFLDAEESSAQIVAAGFDAALVERVIRLVRSSEWKRHQAAPGPAFSARAFGTGRRYPISSGWS